MSTKKISVMAMLVAMSVVLVYLIRIPIFPSAPYLEYDPADIPILIGAFSFGPLAGVIITVVVSTIQAFTVSASSGVYGLIMHVLATSALVLPASIIYRRHHSRSGALIGLACGIAAMAMIMIVANHFVTPFFTGMPTEAVDDILLPIILPFNLIKGGINSAVTFMVYKVISKYVINNEKLPLKKQKLSGSK